MSGKKKIEYPIYMHVNYLEAVLPLDRSISSCAQAGYDGIELRGYDRENKKSISEYIQSVHRLVMEHGLKVTFGCPNETISPDIAERKKSMDDFKSVIEFASANSIHFLNVFGSCIVDPKLRYVDYHGNGSAYASEYQWKTTIEYFQEAGEFAGKRGVDLCFETHNCYIHDLGRSTARLISAIGQPGIKANFDFGNIYLNKLNKGMKEEIGYLAGKIGYVHMKNVRSFYRLFESDLYWATTLEDGDINNFTLILELMNTGYDGVITVENTMSGDKRNVLKQDLKYIREMIVEINSRYLE